MEFTCRGGIAEETELEGTPLPVVGKRFID